MIKQSDEGVIVNFRIIPSASKNELIFTENGIKIKVTAQPVENKANKAVVEFLSKYLKVPKTSIELIKGSVSKDKVVLIKVTDEVKKSEIQKKLLKSEA